jgi:hypothetical protein
MAGSQRKLSLEEFHTTPSWTLLNQLIMLGLNACSFLYRGTYFRLLTIHLLRILLFLAIDLTAGDFDATLSIHIWTYTPTKDEADSRSRSSSGSHQSCAQSGGWSSARSGCRSSSKGQRYANSDLGTGGKTNLVTCTF